PTCPPSAEVSIRPDHAITFWIPCYDPADDGAPSEPALVSGPSHGTVSRSFGQYVTYTPAQGYVGDDAITLGLTTAEGSATTTRTIHVTADANATPWCSANGQAVTRGAVTATLDCADPDGDPITVSITRAPAHGALSAIDPTT